MSDPLVPDPRSGVVSRAAPGTVAETVARLLALLDAKGMTVFAVIDHRGAAEDVGLELRDTKVVVFGNPRGGTPVMQAVPEAAIDLPLKILVWDDGGTTRVGFVDPTALAARYDLADDLAAPLAGITALVDALVNPST